MRLVTFGDGEGRVGMVDGEEIAVLDVPTMRGYFERGGADVTGERVALPTRASARRSSRRSSSTPRATSASTRPSRRTSAGRTISRRGSTSSRTSTRSRPGRAVIYPEHLTEELSRPSWRSCCEAREVVSPEEAMEYVGGYVIFNDITARDIQRGEMRWASSRSARRSTRSARSGS